MFFSSLKFLGINGLPFDNDLNALIASDNDYQRQSELGICSASEMKKYDNNYEVNCNINGRIRPLSHINPRFLYEEGLNTMFIKTSAFYLNYHDFIRNSFINKYPFTGEYSVNLACPTITGLKPLLFLRY